MFVLNFVELSSAVHELSCIQWEKKLTKTMLSIATAQAEKYPTAADQSNEVQQAVYIKSHG